MKEISEDVLKAQAGRSVMRLIAYSNDKTIIRDIANQINKIVDSDSLEPISDNDKHKIIDFMKMTEIVIYAKERVAFENMIEEIRTYL